jgi:pimeloyl-ACP methyl ester carboxylesterase
MVLDVDSIAMAFYSNCPYEEARRIAMANTNQSAQSFQDPLTYAGYNNIPVTWMFTDDDVFIPPDLQRRYIAQIEKSSRKRVEVMHYATDHCPNISEPEAMVECIRRVAGENFW